MSELPPDPSHETSRLPGYDVLRSIGAIAVTGGDVRAAVDCLSDEDLTRLFVLVECHALYVVMAARSGPLRAIISEE